MRDLNLNVSVFNANMMIQAYASWHHLTNVHEHYRKRVNPYFFWIFWITSFFLYLLYLCICICRSLIYVLHTFLNISIRMYVYPNVCMHAYKRVVYAYIRIHGSLFSLLILWFLHLLVFYIWIYWCFLFYILYNRMHFPLLWVEGLLLIFIRRGIIT